MHVLSLMESNSQHMLKVKLQDSYIKIVIGSEQTREFRTEAEFCF